MPDETIAPCPDCGLVAGPTDGPTHPYIGASPGCWALFTELMAIGPGGGVPGQLAGDTYGAQHPGLPERRAIQSVCVHLISLAAALERGWPAQRAPDLLRRALRHPTWWRPLEVDRPIATITVANVLAEADPVRRGETTAAWAANLWASYQPFHALVRGWLDTLIGPDSSAGRGGAPPGGRRSGRGRRS